MGHKKVSDYKIEALMESKLFHDSLMQKVHILFLESPLVRVCKWWLTLGLIVITVLVFGGTIYSTIQVMSISDQAAAIKERLKNAEKEMELVQQASHEKINSISMDFQHEADKARQDIQTLKDKMVGQLSNSSEYDNSVKQAISSLSAKKEQVERDIELTYILAKEQLINQGKGGADDPKSLLSVINYNVFSALYSWLSIVLICVVVVCVLFNLWTLFALRKLRNNHAI
jgi:hypothetical protein